MTASRSMIRWLGVFVAVLTLAAPAAAQEGTITGIVRSAEGGPISGAQVFVIQASENVPDAPAEAGTLTQSSGRYLLRRIPAGEWVVRVELIGFGAETQNVVVAAGETVTADFTLETEAIGLDEIVVTGVSGATAKAKVPFVVDQIGAQDLPAPSVDPITAIQGKVAGATIYSGSGRPGESPTVLLRGATSINAFGRSQEPLFLVDGVIIGADMIDINSGDIESIEVIKGSAAASLYGSRAANGVVQITTKRGGTVVDNQVRYTVRSEYGANRLPEAQIVPRAHFFLMNADQTAFIQTDGTECVEYTQCASVQLAGQGAAAGESANDWNTYMINPYPGQTYDQVDRFFNGGDYIDNYVSASGRAGATNFHVSFGNLSQQGVMTGMEGFNRNNFRVNLDQSVRDNFQLSASAFYSQSIQDDDQGGPMFRLTRQRAGANLLACMDDPDTPEVDESTQTCEDDPENLILITDPFNAEEAANPIYELLVEENTESRSRFLGGLNARWSPISWLSIDANASYDRLDREDDFFLPKGYRTVEPSPTTNDGFLSVSNIRNEALNASITGTANFSLGDGIDNRTQVRYLYEQDDFWSSSFSGYDFAVSEVRTFDNVDTETFSGDSYQQSVRADGYFLISNFDIYDRYIIDALIRNDGSSLFGEDERRHWYYRLAGAWRVGSESFMQNIEAIDELKLRVAYGTAGNRPNFIAQYETYSVSGGVIRPVTLGNVDLKPEHSAEMEVGFDASIFNQRIGLGLTYANTVTTDQILRVPQLAYTGWQRQYQNAGTLESKTWEATVDAVLVRTRDVRWSARVLFDRTRSTITELNAPVFTYGVSGQELGNIYFAREGEEMGTFYGALIATECAHLPEGTDCSLFETNDEGLLVYTGGTGFDTPEWGTQYTLPGGGTVNWGAPIRGECIDRTTEERTDICPVGNSVPDFHVSLSSTLQWGGLQLYGLLDAEQGFDVYNQTQQWAVFAETSAICDQSGLSLEEAKPLGYCKGKYFGVGGLQPSTLFAQDGSYVKLRELSARYTFGADQLGGIPFLNSFSGITLTASGRNLVTWTDYTGYDPEVGRGGGDTGSAALARVDAYIYPNFRTYTFGVEVNF